MDLFIPPVPFRESRYIPPSPIVKPTVKTSNELDFWAEPVMKFPFDDPRNKQIQANDFRDLYFIRDQNNSDPKPYDGQMEFAYLPVSGQDKLGKCFADYHYQCSNDIPYICTEGLVKGSCTSNPNVWQESRMCNKFCDVRGTPDVRTRYPDKMYWGIRQPEYIAGYPSYMPVPDRSKEVKCPINSPKCPASKPYKCISGLAFGGCTDNKQTFQNDQMCFKFCRQ
jgi:hypothetical protein